ncbi:MAG: hypothetical protein QOJ84_1382, partial [Bradyrhizobium sp.]|nr:hypothetical protein [Bradyrhizobium sp.]
LIFHLYCNMGYFPQTTVGRANWWLLLAAEGQF